MTEKNLGKVSSCVFGNRAIIALDQKWIQFNNGKSLEFEVTINEKNQLVLSANLAGGERTNASTGESTNEI